MAKAQTVNIGGVNIKQSVINSFDRVGFPYMDCIKADETLAGRKVRAFNRFGGGSCETSMLISECINWVYRTSNAYERGDYSVKISDFDRIRYFVLAEDSNAYMTCLD